ncbi:uncharacterized protein Z520_08504 [Fonsecaea multimorphosa CBS 102226]|uniref:Uncharacterized protein n=1 Tax=Fonsecaea multimorphosa CBS 102226 TaxID=1442371 RepID=A0A0D2IFA8_9EURO|nr:uncharacterized protein Z520_08504 [Fonsecaea multimorphosa CBS 102226]KIX95796.1 hypothetical protein Z520_08504 [Fonsecaea multimorphosa CBS 102226]OAL21532.1 hypothetical protein AYO22_07928 [Fonsecaea multimorphosa]
MLDDIQVGYASAQLKLANESIELPTAVSLSAISFGKSVYVYLNFAIDMLLLLLVSEETVRHRGWKSLSTFDCTKRMHSSPREDDLVEAVEQGTDDKDLRRFRLAVAGTLVPYHAFCFYSHPVDACIGPN